MKAEVLALASRGSYTVVTTHAAQRVQIVFGDPAKLFSLDPEALERVGYQGHLVGEQPVPCAWTEPCASSVYLVKGRDGACSWLESCSTLGSEGELIVNTRAATVLPTSMLTPTCRLSMAGAYLGPIAHELNNMVQGVSSMAYLFRDCLEQGDPITSEDLDQLSETATDLTTLAAELQSFAQVELHAVERLDFRIVLTRALRLLRAVGRLKTLDLDLQLPDELPAMQWRRFELDCVLLELLGNAADAALLPGQQQTIGVSVAPLDDALQIEITNSGRDFEMLAWQAPFRTSKRQHQHLGLGLSTVLAIVASRGGSLQKLSQAGGTCMRLVLPFDS